MRALSRRNDDPERACRPFDSERDGFVMGEAGAMLVLEELEHAQGARREDLRRARRLRRLLRRAAHHRARPDGRAPGARDADGARRRRASTPSEIDYVNAHGTSTPLGDASETRVIKNALGEENARKTPSPRRRARRATASARPARSRRSSRRWRSQERLLPPTINYEQSRPRVRPRLHPERGRARPTSRSAMSNSFGFGGHNASIVLKRWDGYEPTLRRSGMSDRWATFDCYGTLIDWDGGIRRELAGIFGEERADELLARYHEVEPEIQAARPGALVPRGPWPRLAASGSARPTDGARCARPTRCRRGTPFPEVPAALEEAQARGWKLAILSNTDRDFIDASKRGSACPFDETIVASEIGSYKPALRHWAEFFARTQRRPRRATSTSPRATSTTSSRRRARPAERLDQPARREPATRRRHARSPDLNGLRGRARRARSGRERRGFMHRPATPTTRPPRRELINAFDRAFLEDPDTVTAEEVVDWWLRLRARARHALLLRRRRRLAGLATVYAREEATLDLDALRPPRRSRAAGSAAR